MEAKHRNNRERLGRTLISLFFGIFMTVATSQAQILGLGAPDITVQPVGTNVPNGDSITLTAGANCSLGDMCSVTWVYVNGKNGNLPSNATVTTTGLGTMNVSSTLTLGHVTSACAGTYYVEIEDELLGGLLGITTATSDSQKATVGAIQPVMAVPGGSAMVAKGFRIQFSGPVGSNLVIQASSDTIHWTSVYTNVLTGGSLTYTDTVAKTVPGRYYRAKLK